jgi:hypothetical protein
MVYSYTTPALVAAELRSSTPFDYNTYPSLATIQEWIFEDSAYINGIANTIFGSTTVVEYIDYDGSEDLFLDNAPLIGVTTVEYNAYPIGSSLGSSWITKTEDTDYTSYLDRGVVRILSNWSPSTGSKRIRVTYASGYEEVPLQVRMLCTKLVTDRVLESLIRQNINERNDGGSVSVGSISIVEPTSYGVNSFKQLKSDIQHLKEEILSSRFKGFRLANI